MTITDGQGSTQPADEWAHLAQLAEAATPGPWKVRSSRGGCTSRGGRVVADIWGWAISSSTEKTGRVDAPVCQSTYEVPVDEQPPDVHHNAEFIAAANPATILRLIAERDEARAEGKRYADTLAERNRDAYALRRELAAATRLGRALADALAAVWARFGDLPTTDPASLREWREWQDARQ